MHSHEPQVEDEKSEITHEEGEIDEEGEFEVERHEIIKGERRGTAFAAKHNSNRSATLRTHDNTATAVTHGVLVPILMPHTKGRPKRMSAGGKRR
jgi:hypothetical protein